MSWGNIVLDLCPSLCSFKNTKNQSNPVVTSATASMEKYVLRKYLVSFFLFTWLERGQLKFCEQPVLDKAPARVLQALGGPRSIIWGLVVNGIMWFMTKINLTSPHILPSVH